jgi:glycerol uptake facilitator-like aquaporin
MQTQPTPKSSKLVVSKKAIIALSVFQIVGAILAIIIQVILYNNSFARITSIICLVSTSIHYPSPHLCSKFKA